jgi:hypothetical protein
MLAVVIVLILFLAAWLPNLLIVAPLRFVEFVTSSLSWLPIIAVGLLLIWGLGNRNPSGKS